MASNFYSESSDFDIVEKHYKLLVFFKNPKKMESISSQPVFYSTSTYSQPTPTPAPGPHSIPSRLKPTGHSQDYFDIGLDSLNGVPYPQGYTPAHKNQSIFAKKLNLKKKEIILKASLRASRFSNVEKKKIEVFDDRTDAIRAAGGEVWNDPTMLEWGKDDFRIFCGDLGKEVTDEMLKSAFIKYPSFVKARVIRDKKSYKTKGYGFVSFTDPNDFVKALNEMNGKYIGTRPVKLRKSNWDDRTVDKNDISLIKKVKKSRTNH